MTKIQMIVHVKVHTKSLINISKESMRLHRPHHPIQLAQCDKNTRNRNVVNVVTVVLIFDMKMADHDNETPKTKQIRELTSEINKQMAFADPHLFKQAQEWKRQLDKLKEQRSKLHQRLLHSSRFKTCTIFTFTRNTPKGKF